MPPNAPMPLPKTFHDIDLLQFEPFLTEFVVRRSWQGHNGRKISNIWPKRAVDLIRTDQSARKAAQGWLDCICLTEQELPTNSRRITTHDDGSLELFIEFYWYMSEGRPDAAVIAANSKLKDWGYTRQLTNSWSKARVSDTGDNRGGRKETKSKRKLRSDRKRPDEVVIIERPESEPNVRKHAGPSFGDTIDSLPLSSRSPRSGSPTIHVVTEDEKEEDYQIVARREPSLLRSSSERTLKTTPQKEGKRKGGGEEEEIALEDDRPLPEGINFAAAVKPQRTKARKKRKRDTEAVLQQEEDMGPLQKTTLMRVKAKKPKFFADAAASTHQMAKRTKRRKIDKSDVSESAFRPEEALNIDCPPVPTALARKHGIKRGLRHFRAEITTVDRRLDQMEQVQSTNDQIGRAGIGSQQRAAEQYERDFSDQPAKRIRTNDGAVPVNNHTTQGSAAKEKHKSRISKKSGSKVSADKYALSSRSGENGSAKVISRRKPRCNQSTLQGQAPTPTPLYIASASAPSLSVADGRLSSRGVDKFPRHAIVASNTKSLSGIVDGNWDDQSEGQHFSDDVNDEEDTPLADVVRFASATSSSQHPALEHTAPTISVPRASAPEPSTLKESVPPPPMQRPPLPVQPPIWAQSRQELCESFDWFRSYQGGVYFLHNIVKGYLLSAYSSDRDICHHDGRLIISHGGGKSEALHSKKGQIEKQSASDQLAEDKSVKALLNTFKTGQPVVLLIDDRYSLFPFDLAAGKYTYVVLGFYKIVHAWADLQLLPTGQRVVRYKFAFQWCDQQGIPWWCQKSPTDVPLPFSQMCLHNGRTPADEPSSRPEPMKIATENNALSTSPQCVDCGSISPSVYTKGWMCLNPRCSSFWVINGRQPLSESLLYEEDFLKLTDTTEGCQALLDILPEKLPDCQNMIVTDRRFTKGMHCRVCGRLSSRSKWECWECESCGLKHKVLGRIRDPKDFWSQVDTLPYRDHRLGDNGIQVSRLLPFSSGNRQCSYRTYTLPGDRGKIHLIQGHPLINEEANQIFQEYQEQASSGQLEFRRFPMKSHKCRGRLLTNYFSQNTGAQYQYVGSADQTVPLEDACSAVRRALNLIRQRVKDALKNDVCFNEILSAAYMEKQSMAYHSDSERGLGSVVAALSLGSVAFMSFRLHSRYAKSKTTGKSVKGEALRIVLKHGDIVVMDGFNVQNYYEHTVIPRNFRIAATARCISKQNRV